MKATELNFQLVESLDSRNTLFKQLVHQGCIAKPYNHS